MNSIILLRNLGFHINNPKVLYSAINDADLIGIPLREYGNKYRDIEEKIGGNLFNWLRLGFNVLCKVDVSRNTLLIFNQTAAKLSERFNVQLQLEIEDSIKERAFHEFMCAYALSHFIIEKIVFNLECNRLMKTRHPIHTGLLKYFQIWLIGIELSQNSAAYKYWNLFQSKFNSDVNEEVFTQFTNEVIGNAFLYCFFRGINNESFFFERLAKGIQVS